MDRRIREIAHLSTNQCGILDVCNSIEAIHAVRIERTRSCTACGNIIPLTTTLHPKSLDVAVCVSAAYRRLGVLKPRAERKKFPST